MHIDILTSKLKVTAKDSYGHSMESTCGKGSLTVSHQNMYGHVYDFY